MILGKLLGESVLGESVLGQSVLPKSVLGPTRGIRPYGVNHFYSAVGIWNYKLYQKSGMQTLLEDSKL